MSKFKTKSGFTLIELLAVIVVIGILAALLFPVLTRAREKGRQTTCLSNERQLGQAISLYAQDYDQAYPPASTRSMGSWPELIDGYLRNFTVFVCPSQNFPPDAPSEAFNLQGRPIPCRVSYAYNIRIGGVRSPRDPYATNKTLAQVVKPAATVLLTDGGTTAEFGVAPERWKPKTLALNGDVVLADATVGGVVDPKAVGPVAPDPRHQEKTDVLFADGHCQARSIISFFVLPGQRANAESKISYSPCLDPGQGCP